VPQIRLQPFAEAHLDALAPVLADPEVHRFTRVPVPVPEGFARSWLERYEHGRRDGTREAFAIVDDADGSFLGLALAPRIDVDERTAELGYVVAPHARGRGVASESLRLLTEWAFSTLGMERVELLISPANVASKRVAERCGYVREGVLRSLHMKVGVREDTEIWSRLPTDP
jgi:RimJ/RimL family protein N-acetyltransferase